MLLKSNLFVASPVIIDLLRQVDDSGCPYDLNKFMEDASDLQVKQTECRVWDYKSLRAVVQAVSAGVFGRASKSRYFVRIKLGDTSALWYPLFMKVRSVDKYYWEVNARLELVVEELEVTYNSNEQRPDDYASAT